MATSSEMAPAESVSPVGLAAYEQGAVVSRTLLKRAGGSITLFAFDEGQALSERSETLCLTPRASHPRMTRAADRWRVGRTVPGIILSPA